MPAVLDHHCHRDGRIFAGAYAMNSAWSRFCLATWSCLVARTLLDPDHLCGAGLAGHGVGGAGGRCRRRAAWTQHVHHALAHHLKIRRLDRQLAAHRTRQAAARRASADRAPPAPAAARSACRRWRAWRSPPPVAAAWSGYSPDRCPQSRFRPDTRACSSDAASSRAKAAGRATRRPDRCRSSRRRPNCAR